MFLIFVSLSILLGHFLIEFTPHMNYIHEVLLCDPVTIAGVAAPLVISQLMPKRSAPSFNAPAAANMFPEYQDKMLEDTFNPNSKLYEQAGNAAMSRINRQAARRGLANSGAAMGAMSQASSDLADKFLQSETDRRAKAYAAATGANMQNYNSQMAASQGQYNAANNEWNQQLKGDAAMGDAISGFIKSGTQYGVQNGWFGGGSPAPSNNLFTGNVNPGYGSMA